MYNNEIFNGAIFNILGKNHTSGMICYVIQRDPCAVSWKNDNFDGDLPLHYAIKKRCSLRTIQVLLKAYPNAVNVKNNKRLLPIDCANLYGSSDDILQELFNTADPRRV